MSSEYEIAFYGKLVEGISYEEARARLMSASSMDEARADTILSSFNVVVLERGLQEEEARYFAQKIRELGLIAEVEPTLESGLGQNRTYLGPVVPEAVRAQSVSNEQCAPAARPAPTTRDLPFEFTGKGSEFFKIWIVNVLLSIVTLGIYSAWAKVRTMRYFYGNTRLDGSSFEYLADPIKVLKGRVIAAVFLAAYVLVGQVSPELSVICLLVLLAVTPWVIARSLRFRARYSAWRGVRFDFSGTTGGAAIAYLGWYLLSALTLGLLIPQWIRKQMHYVVNNMKFGGATFENNANTWPFYSVFLKLFGIGVLFVIVMSILAAFLQPLVAIVLPFFYFFVFAYVGVALLNLQFNHTVVGQHAFRSNYDWGSYFVLILTNTLGIVFTLGLFYPFAKVRTARYKAEHTRLMVEGDLSEFVAGQEKDVSAMGSEVGDLFDIDIGF